MVSSCRSGSWECVYLWQDAVRAREMCEAREGCDGHRRCTVQVVPLDPDDGSAVVVTVARYQTPAGVDINKRGIQPDLTASLEGISPENVCQVLSSQEAPRLF